MTPISAHRPQMLVEDFEELAHSAPETVTLEFINGKIEVKPVPDGDHGEIFMWLLERCMQQRTELRLYPERGLITERYRKGRARPDGALVPLEHFAGQGEWAPAEGVLMAVEITSHDHDTRPHSPSGMGGTPCRDREEKVVGYAAAGIPVYLLIDRETQKIVVLSEPQDEGLYGQRRTYGYGDVVVIPDPVGITLETEKLRDFVR